LLNSPVQGTSANITKKALCLLHEILKDTGIRIVACIHDEIILEAPIGESEVAAKILHDFMVEAGQCYLKKIPVEVDVSEADNWSEK
jgi:DNA polymerase I-like protein with 3'-5' exonuclease and polymerase domains